MKYGVRYTARNGDKTVERTVRLVYEEHVEIALDLKDEDACVEFLSDLSDIKHEDKSDSEVDVEWRRLRSWAGVLCDLYRLGLDITIEEY